MSYPVSADAVGADLVVVSLGQADAGELLTLQRAAYVTEARAHRDFGLPALTQSLGELQAELSSPDAAAFGVREGGRLVGAARLRRAGAVAELGRLVVAPDRQGNGIGTRLARHAERVFPEVTEIRLFTGEHSLANIRLYCRLGYRETGRTPVAGYDLVHFAKELGQPGGVGARVGELAGSSELLRAEARSDNADVASAADEGKGRRVDAQFHSDRL